MPPVRRPPGRPLADASGPSLERILDAALDLFGDEGFEGTSIRDLSRTLGVSHNLVNVRVGSKRQLWEAAIGKGMTRMQNKMAAAASQVRPQASVTDRMGAILTAFLQAVSEQPATLKVMNSEGARGGERLDFIMEHYFDFTLAPIRDLLAEGVHTGEFRDVDFAALFLLVAHGGGALLCLEELVVQVDGSERLTATTPESRIAQIVDLVLRGLAGPA